MYIEIHDWKEFEQKVLYFKLSNSFNMNLTSELNHKIAGLYAIYKDDICLYVGQSQNLASRLATHLKGKYENVNNIYIWNIENIGFPDFRGRTKEAKSSIILNSEKYLMTLLKPIENLDIDMSFVLKDNERPEICIESDSTYTIQLDSFSIKMKDNNISPLEEVFDSFCNSFCDNEFTTEEMERIDEVLKVLKIRQFADRVSK